MTLTPRNGSNRFGIGLIEVIICTALVTVMIIPIAAVIRSSGQSIARANGSTSTEADLRRGLRWLATAVRSSRIVRVRNQQLQLQLPSGNVATVRVRRGSLMVEDGGNQTILVENVRDIRFTESTRPTPPNSRVGISMTLRARDTATGNWVTIDSTVAIPPQV